jgi:hypothetical protein
MVEEHCMYETSDTAPVSIFENYKWRGLHLASFALFEYCMLVCRSRAIYLFNRISHPKELRQGVVDVGRLATRLMHVKIAIFKLIQVFGL